MATPSDWMQLAESNLDAAIRLRESNTASSVSRAYYAAYGAAHAIAISKGESPPVRGNWPHEGLGELVRTVLGRGQKDWQRQQVLQYKQALNVLLSMRIRADYSPKSSFEQLDWISPARMVVAMGRKATS
jgi:uncharacterized protein (UPF0332 family)